ncbi:MAG: DUF2304 family protein [Planctomycetes bacterium]|nr:DUF2304 family protein [Planctomycetota bacterium]
MTWTLRIVLLVLGLGLLGVMVGLVRQGRVRGGARAAWFLTGLVLIILALAAEGVVQAAEALGAPPLVLVLLVLAVCLAVAGLVSAARASRQEDRAVALERDIASLRDELNGLRDEVNQPPPPPAEPKPRPPSLRT